MLNNPQDLPDPKEKLEIQVVLDFPVDLAHKDQAIDIDTTCFQLETNSHEIALRPGINQVGNMCIEINPCIAGGQRLKRCQPPKLAL